MPMVFDISEGEEIYIPKYARDHPTEKVFYYESEGMIIFAANKKSVLELMVKKGYDSDSLDKDELEDITDLV